LFIDLHNDYDCTDINYKLPDKTISFLFQPRNSAPAKNFEEWLDCLFNNLDYYAGISFVKDWNEKNVLLPNQRLCPIKPFVMGGDYERKNFYALDFPKYIEYGADIAKQIFNLKDGQKVKLVIKTGFQLLNPRVKR
jgi:hypothetical protein